MAARSERPLPAGLRSGIEGLSGIAMDDVRVVRGSAEPGRLGAHAFARGVEIHLGPGAEGELAHEAWHVVQQKTGRVPTTLAVGGQPVNADPRLEHEADVMGARAAMASPAGAPAPSAPPQVRAVASPVLQARWLILVGKAQFFWEAEMGADKGDEDPPAFLASFNEVAPLPHGTYHVDSGQRVRRGSRPPSRYADPEDELDLASLGRGAPQTLVQTVDRFIDVNKGTAQPRSGDQYNPFGRFVTTPVCSYWPAAHISEQQRAEVVDLLGKDKRFVAATGRSQELTAHGNPKQVVVAGATGPATLDVLEEGPYGAIYGVGSPGNVFAAHDPARAADIGLLGIAAAPEDFKIAANFRIDGQALRAWAGTKRSQSQSQVMGASAADAVANAGYLRDEGLGWEWLHLIAHSMGGITAQGPQVAANLVAGTSECNSQMIVAEEFVKDYVNRFAGHAALTVGVRMLDRARHIADQINYDFEFYNATGEPVAVYHWTFYPLLRQQPSAIENRVARAAGRVVHAGGGQAWTNQAVNWGVAPDQTSFTRNVVTTTTTTAPHMPRSQPTAHGVHHAIDPENALAEEAERIARSGRPADLVEFLRRTSSPPGTPSRFVLQDLSDWIAAEQIGAYLAVIIPAFGERAAGRVVYGYLASHPGRHQWMLEQVLAPLYNGTVPDALVRLCKPTPTLTTG